MTPPPALLVAVHGSRDGSREEDGSRNLETLLHAVRELAPGLPVAGGFAPLGGPPLATAAAELVERRGAREVAVVPLALGQADRATEEFRTVLGQLEDRHAGTAFAGTTFAYWNGHLGGRPELLEVLERRLGEALGQGRRRPSDRARTTVLLVAPGSGDAHANAEVYRVARLLWEGGGWAGVEVAFASRAMPDVPAGLDRCARLGAGRGARIVVLPFFLFDGVPTDRLRQEAEGWAEAAARSAMGPEVRFAGVVGPGPELAELLLSTYGELPPLPAVSVPAGAAGRPG